MAGEPSLTGCELWPIPGMTVQAALSTPEGPGLAFLAGAKNAPEVLIVAGDELDVVRGLAAHAVRQGLGSVSLVGSPGPRGRSLLLAAAELARRRGAHRTTPAPSEDCRAARRRGVRDRRPAHAFGGGLGRASALLRWPRDRNCPSRARPTASSRSIPRH